ncbi:hypothetical protein IW261DRAFT_1424759 [Armillaria novae-zelandiae]|uniref:Uncharacterized protein n=1 Tax=Armillaria novae-zelandiae TaxID=153914 RepID=A0AA39UAV2_9AGAR|nr:hypothetical protein IW261DRAFT_1424759 [Armillaria novae-zelandiae]
MSRKEQGSKKKLRNFDGIPMVETEKSKHSRRIADHRHHKAAILEPDSLTKIISDGRRCRQGSDVHGIHTSSDVLVPSFARHQYVMVAQQPMSSMVPTWLAYESAMKNLQKSLSKKVKPRPWTPHIRGTHLKNNLPPQRRYALACWTSIHRVQAKVVEGESETKAALRWGNARPRLRSDGKWRRPSLNEGEDNEMDVTEDGDLVIDDQGGSVLVAKFVRGSNSVIGAIMVSLDMVVVGQWGG